jgi:hypothetical protein
LVGWIIQQIGRFKPAFSGENLIPNAKFGIMMNLCAAVAESTTAKQNGAYATKSESILRIPSK